MKNELLAKIFCQGAGILNILLVIKASSLDFFGEMSYIIAISSFTAIMISHGFENQLIKCNDSPSLNKVMSIFAWSIPYKIGISLMFFFVASQYLDQIAIYFAYPFFTATCSIYSSYLMKNSWTVKAILMGSTPQIILSLVLLVCISSQKEFTKNIWFYASSIPTIYLLLFLLIKHYQKESFTRATEIFFDSFKFSLKTIISTANGSVDILLVKFIFGFETLGAYSVCSRAVKSMNFIQQAANTKLIGISLRTGIPGNERNLNQYKSISKYRNTISLAGLILINLLFQWSFILENLEVSNSYINLQVTIAILSIGAYISIISGPVFNIMILSGEIKNLNRILLKTVLIYLLFLSCVSLYPSFYLLVLVVSTYTGYISLRFYFHIKHTTKFDSIRGKLL